MKKDVKETNKDNKKLIGFIIAGVIVVAIIIVGVLFFLNKKDNQKELETSLTEMGREFYEDFYYEQVGSSADERTNLLSKFTDIGIKVDLDNLGRYKNGEFKEKISEFKNNKTDEKCNKTNTKVVIYPKSPYGKTDYTIKTELECGFETDK